MANCRACGAPVNLAPDGDPKFQPPVNSGLWFVRGEIVQYLAWEMQSWVYRVPRGAQDLKAFAPECWDFMNEGQRCLFRALIKVTAHDLHPDWWKDLVDGEHPPQEATP